MKTQFLKDAFKQFYSKEYYSPKIISAAYFRDRYQCPQKHKHIEVLQPLAAKTNRDINKQISKMKCAALYRKLSGLGVIVIPLIMVLIAYPIGLLNCEFLNYYLVNLVKVFGFICIFIRLVSNEDALLSLDEFCEDIKTDYQALQIITKSRGREPKVYKDLGYFKCTFTDFITPLIPVLSNETDETVKKVTNIIGRNFHFNGIEVRNTCKMTRSKIRDYRELL